MQNGQGGHAKFGEGNEKQGHAKVLMGEVNMGIGDETGSVPIP